MKTWQWRAAVTATALVLLILFSSGVYYWLITTIEGREVPYYQALQVVVETYTGTGFGGHTTWESTVLNLFVIGMDLSTFLILFIILPYIFQPVLSAALSPDIPESSAKVDHIVICGYSPRVAELVKDLKIVGTEHLVIVDDEETATDLVGKDINVIVGDPSAAETLGNAGVERAAAVVVDLTDVEAIGTVLACRDRSSAVDIIVLGDDRRMEQYMSYAGASRVLQPRELLGKRLSERVKHEYSVQLVRHSLGESLELVELQLDEESPLCGQSLTDIEARWDGAVSILGRWTGDNNFHRPPDSEIKLEPTDRLLLGGPREIFEQFTEATTDESDPAKRICIAGYGDVGATVADALKASGANSTIIDRVEGDNIDVVGDITDESTHRTANIDDATALVMTIPDDDEAILATIIAKEHNPDISVLVRLSETANKSNSLRAGAEYVVSLPELIGKILARDVLAEEERTTGQQIKISAVEETALVGKSIEESQLREISAVIVAVERDGEIRTAIDDTFVFEPQDSLILVGGENAIRQYETQYE